MVDFIFLTPPPLRFILRVKGCRIAWYVQSGTHEAVTTQFPRKMPAGSNQII